MLVLRWVLNRKVPHISSHFPAEKLEVVGAFKKFEAGA